MVKPFRPAIPDLDSRTAPISRRSSIARPGSYLPPG